MICTDGSVPFPFGKGCSGVLANCSVGSAEATLSFPAGPVCSSFSAEACAILQVLCWSRQHQQVCPFSFLLSDSRSVLATCLSLRLSFYLKLSGRSGRNCLLCPPVLSGCNVPGHSFLSGNDAADGLARRGALLVPSAILCSPFSYLSYPLFFFVGLEAYRLIEILRHTGSLDLH